MWHALALAALFGQAPVAVRSEPKLFAPWDGCFVVRNLDSGAELRINGPRADKRFSPCSTFKIPNSAFALETRVVSGPGEVFPWDGVERERRELNRDLTLARAVEVSAVWVFQGVARRVGAERMQALVNSLGYGNRDLSAGLDTFWLASSLKVSAEEQVGFLQRLFTSKLPLRAEVQAHVREMIRVKPPEGADALWAKTGSGNPVGEEPGIGWYVGCVGRKDKRWVFALNVGGDRASGMRAREIFQKMLPTLKLP